VAEAIDECVVGTIADHLRSQRYSRSQVEAVVRIELEHLLPMQLAEPPLFGRQADNQKYAEEIEALVGELLRKLECAPKGTHDVVFIMASRCQQLTWAPSINSPAATHFEKTLLTGLADLQRGCSDIRRNKNGIGDHHNRDQTKQLCAGCAIDLIVGLEAGKPTNSGESSPIRVISGLLFEVIAPDRSADWLKKKKCKPDLREQCVEVVARWRGMSDADRRAHIDQLWSTWEFTGMIARKFSSSS
jgi:hypothetical protein